MACVFVFLLIAAPTRQRMGDIPSSPLEFTVANWKVVKETAHTSVSMLIRTNVLLRRAYAVKEHTIKLKQHFQAGSLQPESWLWPNVQYSPADYWYLEIVFPHCDFQWGFSLQLKQTGQDIFFKGLLCCWPSFCSLALCLLMICLFMPFAQFVLESFVHVTGRFLPRFIIRCVFA